MLTVYTYAKCSTCRDAVKWLKDRGLSFTEKPIYAEPPTVAELRRMLVARGGEIRPLFNTSGADYRAQGLGEKLPSLSEAEALALLAGNGNLQFSPGKTVQSGSGLRSRIRRRGESFLLSFRRRLQRI